MADIGQYNVIVTYNGKTFDVPFIEEYFGIEMTHAHIDLRYVLKSLRYGGGLKRCEKALPMPGIPDIPFKPDRSTIERIRQKWQFY